MAGIRGRIRNATQVRARNRPLKPHEIAGGPTQKAKGPPTRKRWPVLLVGGSAAVSQLRDPPNRSTGVDKKSSFDVRSGFWGQRGIPATAAREAGSATLETEFCEALGQASGMTAALLMLVLGAASPTVGPTGGVSFPCRLPVAPALSGPASEPSARVNLVTAPRECSREGSVVKPPRRGSRR